ncbi:MAG: hypothetical protein DMD33_08055 [Gemmatimonadetes bacterium]|nr:MAG: hypothetical protein DMD33_08055 [Gemmatimonadota bacterium]PYO75944.1 MAG: hypothetical protein DMD67_10020 [Gemmatimonadota bacterium]PYO99266.1 MAG: hypothetical protein DMD61_07730 [Gemmatimonadota bacterium]TLY52680.1 MAG: hypothetical protein E6K55_08930 [Gemmatimonadota bacterium]
MNPESKAFSAEPDRVLGAELRALLDRPGEAEFVAAVMAGAAAAGVGSTRAVLGRWARLAVAGLIVAAVGSALVIRSTTEPAATLDTEWVAAATGSAAAAALFTSQNAPDATVLYASVESN